MMDINMIIDFARKGIIADIRKLEAKVATGRTYLRALERGEKIKSPRTYWEIEEIVSNAKLKIKELSDMEMELRHNQCILTEDELYKLYRKEA